MFQGRFCNVSKMEIFSQNGKINLTGNSTLFTTTTQK